MYYLLFLRFALQKSPISDKNVTTPVSILVYSKNEQDKIPVFLKQFGKQTHANFELILINNASTDDTRYIFEEYEKIHDNVSIVNVVNNENFWGSRKYALTLGVKKAKFENLLFTNTAAIFDSKNWITENVNLISSDKQILVGHSYFKKGKGFLNALIRFSELISNLQNYGWGSAFKPYKASQSNFGYTKSLFFEANGFSDHMNIQHGAEDLFLQYNATSKNVVIPGNSSSFVKKETPVTFDQWLIYKVGQLKIAKHYKLSTKLHLNLFGCSQFVFFVMAILSCIYIPSVIVFGVIVFRYAVAALVLAKTAIKLNDASAIYFFPIMEIVNSLMQIPIFIRNFFSK